MDRVKAIDGRGDHSHQTEALLRARVLSEFGDETLKQITAPAERSWLAAMSEEGLAPVHRLHRPPSPRTDSRLGRRRRPSRHQPAKKAKAPAMRPRLQLSLTAEELRKLADECGGYETLVWFLGWSRFRFGEAGGFANRTGRPVARRRIRVEETATEVGGRFVFGDPKTYEARTVMVPRFVVELVQPHLEDKDPDGLVHGFPGRAGPTQQLPTPSFLAGSGTDRETEVGAARPARHRSVAGYLVGSLDQGSAADARPRRRQDDLDVYGSLFEGDLETLADRI